MRETQKQSEKREAIEKLREKLPPGSTVYCVLRHVSRSGMCRWIDFYRVEDGQPIRISHSMALAAGLAYDRNREAVKIGGCGMDMGFAAVYDLCYALYPQGFDCVGESCPSNDHSNGDRNYKPHHHAGGGYALRHSWM